MAQVLRQLPQINDPNILVGTNTADDAAVYKVNDSLAIVQSVDYFTPVVDDPYTFGLITAANSLSDLYAMGAQPLFALNIVGFPSKKLSMDVLAEILKGGAAKAAEAGISVIGGHTIDDPEPKYGMVVTAVIDPSLVVTNAGAKAGDMLVLTKPLGLGIITTAMKKGLVSPQVIAEAIEVMSTLNKGAAEAMVKVGVNACTDITGFGFLGHLHEMAKASHLGAKILLPDVPVIPETWNLIKNKPGVVPGGTQKNLEFLREDLIINPGISEVDLLVLSDAQTSGGLLISVTEEKLPSLLQGLKEAGVQTIAVVGKMVQDDLFKLEICK